MDIPGLDVLDAALPAEVDQFVAERVLRQELRRRAELAEQLGYGFDADALLPNALRVHGRVSGSKSVLAAFSDGVKAVMGMRGAGPHPWRAEFVVLASDDPGLARTIDGLADLLKDAFCHPGSDGDRVHYQTMCRELNRLGEELQGDPAAPLRSWTLSRKMPFTVAFEISYSRGIEGLYVEGPDDDWDEAEDDEPLSPSGLRPGSVWETVGGELRPVEIPEAS